MKKQGFLQEPPRLGNQFDEDLPLRRHLERLMPAEALEEIVPQLRELGSRAAGELQELGDLAEANPPELVHYDAWGRRVDDIVVHPAWNRMLGIAAEEGLIGVAYERPWGGLSRVHQAALIHLFNPSTATASCPLAMTDGAARTMETWAKDEPFSERALRCLTSRDAAEAWTSGQWMTEKEGGSDVGRTSTEARRENGEWRLYGTKYFTSATTAECTLTLARPEGSGPGSRPLTMFYLEPWNDDGTLNNIVVRRLKDKLGTKALPTAELELEGALAYPVGEVGQGGVRQIATVLNISRYWNAASCSAAMRRGVAMAVDYAHRREAFGKRLIDHPLHAETLADLQVRYEGTMAIVMRLAELLGKSETNDATEREKGTLRLLTPIAKLFTGKEVVKSASETLETFGGSGYMEDTGIPRLLRDAQVLPIWEGTTNILSLDCLRAIAREEALQPFLEDALARLDSATDPRLAGPVKAVQRAVASIGEWFGSVAQNRVTAELGARRFSMSLGRTYAAALLCEQAAFWLERDDTRPLIAAQRWVEGGLLQLEAINEARFDEARSILERS